MKTKAIFLFLLSFFYFQQAQAQDLIIDNYEPCVGDCTYMQTDSFFVADSVIWTIQQNGLAYGYVDGGFGVQHCWEEAGWAIIFVEYYDGTELVFATETELLVNGNGSLDIRAESGCYNPDSLGCALTCAYSTVTYSVVNSNGTPLDWSVTGAESFEVNQNSVTVEWGDAGTGTVAVFSGNPTNNPQPLNLDCYQPEPCEPGGGCVVGFYVEGGVPPYDAFITDSGGNTYSTFTFFENNIIVDVAGIGDYEIMVTDAGGQTAACSLGVVEVPFCTEPIVTSVQIQPSTPNGCNGAIFIDVTGGNIPYSYTWSDGSTVISPMNLCCGTYSLTITDNNGCSAVRDYTVECEGACPATDEICVEILPEPLAAFTTDPPAQNSVVNICQGQTVYFTNQSQGADDFTWDFGTGAEFNDINAFYTYENPGTYEVSLVAANQCYCADTATMTIIVDPSVGPEIECVGTICEGETVTYSSGDACTIFNWTISGNGTVLDGGGTADNFITVEWGAGPIGTIELATGGCTTDVCNVPTIEEVPIISDNAEIEGPSAVCNETTVSYAIINYSGTEYIWSVSNRGTIVEGQGTSEILVEWSSGMVPITDQSVSVVYENCYLDCGGSDDLAVSILPEFYITGSVESCENQSTTFTAVNAANGSSFPANWTVTDPAGTPLALTGNGNNTMTVNWTAGAGTYTVSLLPVNGGDYCSSEQAELNIAVLENPPAPMSLMGEDEICPSATYSYQVQGLPGHRFVWEINNGGTIINEEGSQVNVAWGASGPYGIAVQQVSPEGAGCTSASTSLAITAITGIAIQELTDACADQVASYSATLYENINYDWSIVPAGAGTIAAGQGTASIEVLWHTEGNATLALSSCGYSETISVNVRPKPQPMVVHPAGLCDNETATVNTVQSFSAYQWLDENGALLGTNPTVDLLPGYYELIVADDFGCEKNTSFFIEPYPSPNITASTPEPTAICGLNNDPFPVLHAIGDIDGYTYEWFLDGVSTGLTTETIQSGQFGTYTVIATNSFGCTAQSNPLSVIDFCDPTGGGVCNGGTCTLYAECAPGTEVTFTTLGPSPLCNERTYQNTSPNYVPGTLDWYAGVGDFLNNVGSDEIQTVTFDKAGYYTVLLRATSIDPSTGDPISCWDAIIDTIPVAADFKFVGACAGSPISFSDLSTFLPEESIISWEWDFDDPTSGTENMDTNQNPNHVFANNGTYNVSLTIVGQNGCTSTIAKTIEVYNPPMVDFQDPEVTCEATATPFIYTGSPNTIELEWDFGDPASGDANTSNIENTFHNYATPGVYTVTLTATNIYGCANATTKTVTIEPNGLSGNISLSQPSPICEGDQIELTAPTGGVAWEWSTGETAATITVTEEDVYSVTITDAEGCTYTPLGVVIEVIPAPYGTVRVIEYDDFDIPQQYFYNDYDICAGEDVFLEIPPVSGFGYQWSTGQSVTEIEFSEERGNLLSAGTYVYTVTVTDNATGCTVETNPMTVEVHAPPAHFTISSNASGNICAGNPVTFTIDNPDPTLTYTWSNEASGTSITVEEPGEYYAIATNAFGCKTESNTEQVLPGPDINLVPSGCHQRCNPDTLCLPPINGIVAYQWYFGGSPVTGATDLEFVATESGTYQLEMTDEYGCTLLSEALTLDLYDGYGDITGNVYFDRNEDGMIDPTDSLMGDIPIQLITTTGVVTVENTDNSGAYLFDDVLSQYYVMVLDTSALVPGYGIAEPVVDTVLIGCDLELVINWLVIKTCPTTVNTLVLETCDNIPVTFDSELLYPNTMTPFVYTNAAGCDSTVMVSVISNSSVSETEDYTTCGNADYDYHGTLIPPGTSQTFNFSTINGCDSTVVVNVAELPLWNLEETVTVCDGESYEYNGTVIEGGDSEVFNFTSFDGCDSVVTVSVNAAAALDFGVDTDPICDGSQDGILEIMNPTGGTPPYGYALNGDTAQLDPVFTDLAEGVYTLQVTDANNCVLELEAEVATVEPLQIYFQDQYILPCQTNSITIQPEAVTGEQTDLALLWPDGTTGIQMEVTEPGIYVLEASNVCGTYEFPIEVGLTDIGNAEDLMYCPNVFSPNFDGINDMWKPMLPIHADAVDYHLVIMNRWGAQIFESNNIDNGWEGMADTKAVMSGVYIYVINATVDLCGHTVEVQCAGDVTVLR